MDNQHSDKLEALRREIDGIDAKIAELLEKRMVLVSGISELKSKTGMAVLDSSREDKVIDNIRLRLNESEYEESIISIFKYIMKTSRDYQQGKRKALTPKAGGKFGLVGEKLTHSVSPQIHGLFFEKCRLQGSYNLIETPRLQLPELVEKLKNEAYSGFNVTVPYKKEIMQYLDSISQEAMRVGAVNTVLLNGNSTGFNTDYSGFGLSLERSGFNPEGKSCAVLGSGGSAHAVIAYLEDHHATNIVIVTRDKDAALFKFPGLSCQNIKTFSARGFDAVINTTPVGMYPNSDDSPISKEQLAGAGFVMDLIYNPAETLLLRFADELGIRHENGLFMLVAQAISAEDIWLGRRSEKDLIASIYEEIKKSL